MVGRPKVNSESQKELDKVEKQCQDFQNEVKDLTLDRMNMAPKLEQEPQTKLSQKDIERSKDIYLKPEKTVASRDKFNENYRKDYNFKKEYVQFSAEHKEIIGDDIEIWTRPFGGMPAEFWRVPVNKPVWGPRYLAEQIKGCTYHRMSMNQARTTGSDGMGQYFGGMVVDSTIQRLDAHPLSSNKSVFMGAA